MKIISEEAISASRKRKAAKAKIGENNIGGEESG
jgi:hypothetical protein